MYKANITTANSCKRNPDQDIMRVFDLWDRMILDFRIASPKEKV